MPVIRDDLSDRLVHLTRGEAAADTFRKIVREGRLLGGTGKLEGDYKCVCFSEAPISKLAYLLAGPHVEEIRYKPFGVMVGKTWLFAQGGRPVIYQPKSDRDLLPESHRFRHVEYEPPDIDVTWEREWRIRIDELRLDPAAVTLVVPTRAWERSFLRKHEAATNIGQVVTGGFGGRPFEWQFVVLEDIGVPFPDVGPPPDDDEARS